MQEGSIDCPYISEDGCEIYEERPMLCRLFGPGELGEGMETKHLSCPNGEVKISDTKNLKKAIRAIKRIGQEYAEITKETGVYGPLCDSEIFSLIRDHLADRVQLVPTEVPSIACDY